MADVNKDGLGLPIVVEQANVSEKLVPDPKAFALAAQAWSMTEAVEGGNWAARLKPLYMAKGISEPDAILLASLLWRIPAIKGEGSVNEIAAFYANSMTSQGKIDCALGTARCMKSINYVGTFNKLYNSALPRTNDKTLAMAMACFTPPNLFGNQEAMIARAIDNLPKVPQFIESVYARHLIVARTANDAEAPLKLMADLTRYFATELNIDQSAASLMAVMPMTGELNRTMLTSRLIDRHMVGAYKELVRP